MSSIAKPVEFFDWKHAYLSHRDQLPHVRQAGVAYFVTFRLYDSLPAERVAQWRRERDEYVRHNLPPHTAEQERMIRSLLSARIERYLDGGAGCCVLREPAAQNVVEELLRADDGQKYFLGDFVVMPNHVHVTVLPASGFELSSLMKSWKGASSRGINQHLGRRGTLWQDESFDHIPRDLEAMRRIGQYIRDNPKNLPAGWSRVGFGMLGSY